LLEESKESITLSIYNMGDKTDCTKFYPTPCCQGKLQMQKKLLGTINVDFETTGQLQFLYIAFVKYFRKNENAMKQSISSL